MRDHRGTLFVMENSEQPEELRKLIEEVVAKQRNTVWPDMLSNGRSVDKLLWNGSPDAPIAQRIGICLFGVTFMVLGAALFEIEREATPDRQSLFLVIPAVLLFFLGLKTFLNGFRRRKREASESE